MSFGVGLGDVLKTSELCWKLFLGMRQAPGELKPLRTQIESLTHTLGIINDLWETNSPTDPSDESRKMSVNKQLSALNDILLQLRVLLEQAASLSTGRKRDKFSWAGLKFSLFDVKDLQKIRQELSIHILGIDLLQHSFNT